MLSETAADIVIVTALTKERDAVLRHIPDPRVLVTKNRHVVRGSLPSRTDVPHDVVVLCVEAMGNVRMAAVVTQAIDVWSPTNVILTGITGGIPDAKALLGDVIVGEQVVDYEFGKRVVNRTDHRYQVFRPGKSLLNAAQAATPNEWAMTVKHPRPDATTGRVIPQVHFGVVASGEKVVKDPEFVRELKEDWAQLIGVEMEGIGAYAAAYEAEGMPGILLVKGICDWADPNKNDVWQAYAAASSAAFVAATLRTLPSASRSRTPPTRAHGIFSGQLKVEVCRRLISDWADVADYFEIPLHARARFEKGREPQGVWEWLEQRDRLAALGVGLESIGRADLVAILKANE